MKKILRLSFLLSITMALTHGCATKTEIIPPDWGEIKTDSDGSCLHINNTFYNHAISTEENGSVKDKTLASVLFPVMQGIDIDKVKIETIDAAITFGIQGKEITAIIGKQNDIGIVACTQRSWMFEVSKLDNAEGTLGVEKRQVYLYLNHDGDLLVREIAARRGVGLLIVPYGDQDVSLYRFRPAE